MAAEGSHNAITESDVTAFAERLDAWMQMLPPKEQVILHLILFRAASVAAGDTSGFSLTNALQFGISPLRGVAGPTFGDPQRGLVGRALGLTFGPLS